MDRRFKALLIAALLCATTALTACGDDANTQNNTDSSQADAVDEDVSSPLDPPALAKLAKAPKGTANADDARLANDVLLQLVADRNVDAQHFVIVVDQSVLYLMPNEDADETEIERVKELVQSIEGITEVKVEPIGAPADAPDEATQEIVAAIEDAHAPDAQDDADDADAQADHHGLAADAPTLEDVAEIAKPADVTHDEEDETADAVDAEEPESEEEEADAEELREYTLRRGDSLSTVAARELGNGARWTEIYKLNRDVIGPNPDGVRDGMKIKLPPR